MNVRKKAARIPESSTTAPPAPHQPMERYPVNWRAFMPVPAVDAARAYVVFQPHSDDAVWFAGGLILKLTKAGKDVTLVTVTDGSLGTADPDMTAERLVAIRKAEADEAARALGVHRHICLPFRDGFLPRYGEATAAMVRIIREEQADAILAPDPWLPYEAHPDHVNCGLSAAACAIYSGLPLYMPDLPPHALQYVAFYLSDRPNQFVDIESELDVKLAILRMFKSQFTPAAYEAAAWYATIKAQELGVANGMHAAEGFKVLTPRHLHTNVDSATL